VQKGEAAAGAAFNLISLRMILRLKSSGTTGGISRAPKAGQILVAELRLSGATAQTIYHPRLALVQHHLAELFFTEHEDRRQCQRKRPSAASLSDEARRVQVANLLRCDCKDHRHG
jgi:hypothetical protein